MLQYAKKNAKQVNESSEKKTKKKSKKVADEEENKKEENFFEYMVGKMNNFYSLINQYLNNPTDYNCNLVKEKLQIDKEFLGFKYWIIKSKPQLVEVFANDIIWNKK